MKMVVGKIGRLSTRLEEPGDGTDGKGDEPTVPFLVQKVLCPGAPLSTWKLGWLFTTEENVNYGIYVSGYRRVNLNTL